MIVIDVGNTNIVIGVYLKKKLSKVLRLNTEKNKKKFKFEFESFLQSNKRILFNSKNKTCVLSSVVPSLNIFIKKIFIKKNFQFYIVNPKKIPIDAKINYNLNQIGSDRVANYIAIHNKKISDCIIIDFGTATTLDCVNAQGDYLGGAIAPGFRISADALFLRTAKLPKVELEKTESVIGKNTITSMQTGLYWGYVGLVDELARRCKSELITLGEADVVHCVATGGLVRLVGQSCSEIDDIDDYLTLRGLVLLYERNLSK